MIPTWLAPLADRRDERIDRGRDLLLDHRVADVASRV